MNGSKYVSLGTDYVSTKDIPRGRGIRYHCLKCDTNIASTHNLSASCKCGNILIDNFRLSIGDFTKFEVQSQLVMSHPPSIIAIDGPSASGKGTLARALAAELGFAYLDTGAVYRMVAKRLLETGSDPLDRDQAIAAAQAVQAGFDPTQLDDPGLRRDDVAQATSKSSAHPEVRALLMDIQRGFAADPARAGAVLDGRDIGTVVCPQAEVKLFVVASPEIRASRRFKELQSRGIQTTYEAVLQDMRDRDARDSGRSVAPLRPAEDAIVFDTSDLTADKALEKALHLVRETLALKSPA